MSFRSRRLATSENLVWLENCFLFPSFTRRVPLFTFDIIFIKNIHIAQRLALLFVKQRLRSVPLTYNQCNPNIRGSFGSNPKRAETQWQICKTDSQHFKHYAYFNDSEAKLLLLQKYLKIVVNFKLLICINLKIISSNNNFDLKWLWWKLNKILFAIYYLKYEHQFFFNKTFVKDFIVFVN